MLPQHNCSTCGGEEQVTVCPECGGGGGPDTVLCPHGWADASKCVACEAQHTLTLVRPAPAPLCQWAKAEAMLDALLDEETAQRIKQETQAAYDDYENFYMFPEQGEYISATYLLAVVQYVTHCGVDIHICGAKRTE